MMKIAKTVSIIISSCDAYSDCWKPMASSFERYWPDREWQTYIIANYKDENLPNIKVIQIGKDNNCWCNLVKKGLEMINTDYVIFFQEDYWLGQKVDNEVIKKHLTYVIENNIDFLKIQNDLCRDEYRIGDTDYCVNNPDIRYSINTAIAIWKRDTMMSLMIDGWNGWQFERNIIPYIIKNNIQFKSQTLHSSVVLKKGIVPIEMDAIVRGVWTPAAVKFLKDNDMDEIVPNRKIMGRLTYWLYKHGKHKASQVFSWSILKLLKNIKVNW